MPRRADGPLSTGDFVSNALMKGVSARRQNRPIVDRVPMEQVEIKQQRPAVPQPPGADAPTTLVAMLEHSLRRHHDLSACSCMGRSLSYAQIDQLSTALAAYLQSLGLVRGDRVAVMLPNVPQYLVAVVAILRAGLVVVNVDPLLAPRDLEHQLKDAGARIIVIMESHAATLQAVLDAVPTQKAIVASIGDLLGPLKGAIANHWMRRVHRLVPDFNLPGSVSFTTALDSGRHMSLAPVVVSPDDIAALQYTGGTTGVSRGVVLLHRCLAANLLQCEAWYRPALKRMPAGEQLVTVGVLPLHHIYGFSLVLLLGLHAGGSTLLIPDPHDTAGLLKVLAGQHFHCFPATNALFQNVAKHADVDKIDWQPLMLSLGGGMAVERSTALLWLLKTGCPICQGYGLTEASPAVTCNPVDAGTFSGHIGLPLPGTEVLLLDDKGRIVPPGTPGEIAVRGPQLMAGYWQRPDETALVMTASGHLRTGDIGVQDESGGLHFVDRKQDLIVVSGLNIYPKEVEDIVARMPGLTACAAVGVSDAGAGEAVKVVLVRSDPDSLRPSEAEVRAWCDIHLVGYQRPKWVEFKPALPRSRVGRVLRRELRDHA